VSRTLFRYIFWDLIRVFALTCVVLAGVMSFGGLLRPLTQHGLDAGQVGKMLFFFLPAMSTYSLPVAALFATTSVYGRLSADNELTAMRASGISYWSIAQPALRLGFVASLVSLLFLCFVVPNFTLKVEQVIYSNLARLVASQIEKTHEASFGDITVFARGAYVPEVDPLRPNEQRVVLIAPAIRTQELIPFGEKKLKVPEDFWLAESATVYIRQNPDNAEEEVTLHVDLQDGIKFPRKFEDRRAVSGGVRQTQFGPVPIPSPIREKTKFMDLTRLHVLYNDPSKSSTVRDMVQTARRREQESTYLESVRHELEGPTANIVFEAGGERYIVSRLGAAKSEMRKRRLDIPSTADTLSRPMRVIQERDGQTMLSADCAQVSITTRSDDDAGRMQVSLELMDAQVTVDAGEVVAWREFVRDFSVVMPEEIRAISQLPIERQLVRKTLNAEDRNRLARQLIVVANDVRSELNARASFAVSCLILVMIGCPLGVMSRSGNFLTAFAVSVVPAMICIVLIVTGQHTCENVPDFPTASNNPLQLGVWLIWSGNLVVMVIAGSLTFRLQRR